MKDQNSTNIASPPPEGTVTRKQYGTPVTPYLDDQERMDKLGRVLEDRYKGEFKRPATISRALDALERELSAQAQEHPTA